MHAFQPQLWRRARWTPDASDETDRETELGGARSPSVLSDADDGSEYVDSEYGDDRAAPADERRTSTRARATEPSTLKYSINQPVWVKVKDAWYIGMVEQIVIDTRSKSPRICPLYVVGFRSPQTSARLRTTADPLRGTIRPAETKDVEKWLRMQR